jgi:hypothetical protein
MGIPYVPGPRYCAQCQDLIPRKYKGHPYYCGPCKRAKEQRRLLYAQAYCGKYTLGSYVELNMTRDEARCHGLKLNKRYRVNNIWWTDDGMVWFSVGKSSGFTSSKLKHATKLPPQRRAK